MIVAKKRKPKSKNYFTIDTEKAIIKYNKENDPKIRSQIYRDEIHYPFFKLTENIIHTFKFYYTEVDQIEHLQHEVIIFLLSKLNLYSHKQNIQDKLVKIITKEFNEKYDGDFSDYVGDVDRVSQNQINQFISSLDVSKECMDKLIKLTPPKAYSYFGTITKNWLIIYNNKNYEKKVKMAPVDDLYKDETYSYKLEDERITDDLSYFIDEYINYVENRFNVFFPKGNDDKIADAILELFRKRENIEIFNKKALYIYIREIMATHGLEPKTPKITKIATKLYDLFKDNYIFFLETGYIDFEKN